ncbi:MAG: hypothetical protein K2P17_02035 [Helicobacteraceae bacterium]|nr:hypothetical protein [Helicobacteraceae bacterium]
MLKQTNATNTKQANTERIKTKRLNGFKYWCVLKEDKFVLLDTIREEFRQIKI